MDPEIVVFSISEYFCDWAAEHELAFKRQSVDLFLQKCILGWQ